MDLNSWVERYCNEPANMTVKDELLPLDLDDLTLDSLAVIIRHGNRGPRPEVVGLGEVSCDPFHAPEDFHMEISQELSDTFKKFEDFSSNFKSKEFELIPKPGCHPGSNLTIIGALQHLRLGQILGNLYGKYNFGLHATSTKFPRTFQSGLAFLFGFLRPDSGKDFEDWSQMSLCTNSYFDSSSQPHSKELEKVEEEIRRMDLEALESDTRLQSLINRLKIALFPHVDVVEANLLNWDSNLLEGCMAHLSHGSNLPESQCNSSTLRDFLDYVTLLELQLKSLSKNKIWQKLCWLRVGQFLKELSEGLNRSKQFNFYSGHDSTIIALGSALGFFDGSLPPYASRLIFEVYTKKPVIEGNETKFLRIIYNGEDVTSKRFLSPLISNSMKKSLNDERKNGKKAFLVPLISLTDLVANNLPGIPLKNGELPARRSEYS